MNESTPSQKSKTPPSEFPDSQNSVQSEQSRAFEAAANEDQLSLIAEFILFLRENKAWWLVPILIAFALIFVAAWLTSSAAAPFIYPLF